MTYELYQAPKPCLSDLVSKHFKPINHDRWASLYCKKKLESPSAAEEKELEALEKENMKTNYEVSERILHMRR